MSDLFKQLEELPVRRYIDVLRSKVSRLNNKLNAPAYFDQYPGKTLPYFYSKIYGPIAMQTPRRTATNAFENLAAVVQPGTFITPRNNNIIVGRDASFYLCGVNCFGFLNWTYAANPGFASPISTIAQGDIFDRAIEDNGGAQVLMNFMRPGTTTPRICFEFELYDKKRGRSITDGRIPAETLLGQAHGFKSMFGPMRFDPDTELEPRVYITEVRMSDTLNVEAAFVAARVRCFLNVVFKGYLAMESDRS